MRCDATSVQEGWLRKVTRTSIYNLFSASTFPPSLLSFLHIHISSLAGKYSDLPTAQSSPNIASVRSHRRTQIRQLSPKIIPLSSASEDSATMPAHLQYTLQRSQPFSALSYPIPKSLLLSSSSKVHAMPSLMAPSSASNAYNKQEFITRDYYADARSPSSVWSSDSSSSDSESDRYDSSDEFCFDDIESRSSKSTLNSSRASTSSSTSSP